MLDPIDAARKDATQRDKRCCEMDTDNDGNCVIHRAVREALPLKFLPVNVDLTYDLMKTFGKSEIEHAATLLILHLQEKNSWSFTFSSLYNYYIGNGLNTDDMLFGLFGPWVDDGPNIIRDDGHYIINWGSGLQVTQEFLKAIAKHVR